MHARRLIAVPMVALAAAMLVGAIIDSGHRARMARTVGPGQVVATPEDPTRAAEARRVRDALDAASRCTGVASCSREATAARVRHAAETISTWPVDPRFQHVRDSLREQLLAQALVLDQRAVDALAGRPTHTNRARLKALEQRLEAATRTNARAQRAAGLISRPAYDALLDELR